MDNGRRVNGWNVRFIYFSPCHKKHSLVFHWLMYKRIRHHILNSLIDPQPFEWSCNPTCARISKVQRDVIVEKKCVTGARGSPRGHMVPFSAACDPRACCLRAPCLSREGARERQEKNKRERGFPDSKSRPRDKLQSPTTQTETEWQHESFFLYTSQSNRRAQQPHAKLPAQTQLCLSEKMSVSK